MKPDRPILLFFLMLVFWLPLPMGSNRNWLWLPAAALTLLLWAWLWAMFRSGRLVRSPAYLGAWLARGLMGAWLVFGLIQFVPLPAAWVAYLSPAAEWPQMAGFGGDLMRGWGTLSVDPYHSMVAWLQSLFLALLFLMALQLINSEQRIGMLVMVMVSAGVLQAIYGSFMTLSGVEWGWLGPKEYNRGVATGTFVNRNHLAGLLVICIAMGIGHLLGQMRERSTRRSFRQQVRDWVATLLGPKMRLRMMLVVMVVALVLSHSRMGNASLFVGLLLAGLIGLLLLKRAPKPMLTLVLSLLVIDVVAVGTWFGVERVVDRIQETGQWDQRTERYRDTERMNVDAEAVQAWQRFRWLGAGGGTFYTVFPAYHPVDVSGFVDHAHNDYLEFLVEYGIVGSGLLFGFLLSALLAALRAQHRRRNPYMRGVGFGVTLSVVAMVMHASVDFNLHIPANAAYFMMVLSLGWLAAEVPSRGRRRSTGGQSLVSSRGLPFSLMPCTRLRWTW